MLRIISRKCRWKLCRTARCYSSHPFASIVYVNSTGLENTWTYHSQSVGRAGTVSVNDYNGNLVLTHGDVSIASGVMPITLNHVFNTHDKDTDLGYGYGWRLNYAQTATPVTISGTNYYKHIDGQNIYAFRLFQGRGRGVSLRRIWRHDRGKHGRA